MVVAVVAGALLAGCGEAAPPRVETATAVTTSTTTTAAAAPEPVAPSPPPPEPPSTTEARQVEPRRATRAERAAPPPPVVKQPPPRPNRAATAAATPPPPPPTSRAVFDGDFPDPFVLRAGAHWYAFSTQHHTTQVPVMRSVDLRSWEPVGDALPALPSWSALGHVWAPAVMARPVGGYALFYSTRDAATGLQCLSRAFSALPQGPYVDTSTGPFVCQTDRGGSIDASPFVAADGTSWLTWKSEGTLDGEPTRIWSAPLAPDGSALTGEPRELLATSQVWEGPIVEAPTMLVDGGTYHLFFSGNRWETVDYAVGHAVCAGPAGPCRRVPAEPVLRTDGVRAGPGGGEVFRDLDGSVLLAHHAWSPEAVGYPAGARRLHIDRVTLDGERATVSPRQDTSMI